MDEAVVTDLKQFILTTVTQQFDTFEAKLEAKFDAKFDRLDTRIDELDAKFESRFNTLDKRVTKLETSMSEMNEMYQTLNTKIDNLSAYVAEALDNSNEAIAVQLKNHEVRITRLEQHAAR